MNAQDVLREVYDSTAKALKTNVVTGTITASSQVTVTPQIAWPDPKTYIGLVTATGNFSASLNGNVTLNPSENWIGLATVTTSNPASFTGNVTLDPGSKTQIVGNVTISDSKGFIGLTTSIIGNAPILGNSTNYIGLVTVANTVSTTFSGNVTLDDGSLTGLVAGTNYVGLASVNVGGTLPALSVGTNFIGLTTVVQSSSERTILGNLTLSDSKGYIGLVSVSHAAWTDPKTYIGLVTATLAGTVNTGSSTIFPGPNQIGSVTVSNPITIGNAMVTVTLGTKLDSANDSVDIKSGATVFIGGPTLFAVVNTRVVSDPGTFIGLTTVTGSALDIRSINSTATIFAVVNTGAVGNTNALATLLSSPNWIGLATTVVGNAPILGASTNYIGLVTVANTVSTTFSGNVTLDAGSKTQIVGNVTLSDSKGFIGLSTVVIGNAPILGGSTNYIGLVTVANNITTTHIGNMTLDPGSKTQIVGNVTISDSKGYIGLVTSTNAVAWPDPKGYIGLVTITGSLAAASGNVTLDPGSKTQIVGNVTLSDPKSYIGLVSISHAAWADPKTFLGLTTSVIGNAPILGASTNYIGLVTVANIVPVTFSGNVTLDGGSKTQIVGNVTLSDPKGYIGLVSVSGNVGFSGNVTLDDGSLTGLVAGANYIGLASVNIGTGQSWIGLTTSTIGNATLYAVVNTGAVGNTNALATLLSSPNYIGLTTTTLGVGLSTIGIVRFGSPITLAASPNYIGLASVNIGGIAAGTNYIGLMSVSGNVGFSGNVTLDAGSKTQIIGNVTISDSKGFIGLTTSVVGNAPILGASTNYIGLVTVANVVSTTFSGNVTLDAGSKTQVVGNITLSDSKGFIGLSTVVVGNSPILGASTNYIGLVTVANTVTTTFSGNVTLDAGSKTQIVGNVTISDSKGYIGLVSVSHAAWADPKTFIGLTTSVIGNPTLYAVVNTGAAGDPGTYIGLTTTTLGTGNKYIGLASVNIGAGTAYIGLASVNISPIPAGNSFIGLVTSWSQNAGTTKTLIHKNIQMYGASIATIAVPTNTFKITHLLMNSDATVRLSIKSGATYLTGNASIGVTLSPNGGWVENGSPDSPIYVGLAGAAAIVVEKYETGVTAKIGGKVIYFDE